MAVAYPTVALAATGGALPYTWSLTSGALPDGLTLTPAGQVSGTPTRAGHFNFVVEVADSAGGRASLSGSVGIAAALTARFLKACGTTGSCSVEQGCVTVCGGFGYQGGGVAPYSYQITSGTPPPGTRLYGLSLSGRFTTTGTFKFKATVTDGLGATASVSPTFAVFAHISFAGGTVTCYYPGCGPQGSNYPPATMPYSGGSGPTIPRVVNWTFACDYQGCGTRPAPALAAGGGLVSITVWGSAGGNGYKGVFTLLLTDNSLCAAGKYCSVSATVNVVVQAG